MSTFTQSQEQFSAFVRGLAARREFWAPVKTDVVRFTKVKDASRIHLDQNAWFPVKEHFFAKREPLFLFIGKDVKATVPDPKPRVFFGLRRCDLSAIAKQDRIYLREIHDPYYAARREHTVLIGYHCPKAPHDYCFCGSMELEDSHDLMYFNGEDGFLIEARTDAGARMIEDYPLLFTPVPEPIPDKHIPGTDRLKRRDMNAIYDHPDWKKGVDLCLSCGACTTLCPTCYCFEIHDETSITHPGTAERTRSWSSCMLPEFTRVAGDHVFRKEREHRFKHRIYHQLQYYKDRYGTDMCTGCGRCIIGCPTRIDFVNIINEVQL